MATPPLFMVTADIAVFRDKGGESLELLLIRRAFPPFEGSWALPGGFVDENENTEMAAYRELEEETSLKVTHLHEFGSFSDPDRDPRRRTITVAYWTKITLEESYGAHGGDDAQEACWFAITKLPDLAFDHDRIVKRAIESLKASEE